MIHTEAKKRRTILEALNQELKGLNTTGMRPFVRDNELMFIQTWVIVIGGNVESQKQTCNIE